MAQTRRVDVATVWLWDRAVGAVAWNAERGGGDFEYDPTFVRQGPQVAPLTMPLRPGIFSFPMLKSETFHGLPGLLADALPDRFGNRIIEAWLARQGRSAEEFTPVERLCYMGVRGMGALEFKPAIGPRAMKSVPIEVAELTQLVTNLDYGDRAELAGLLIDSLDGEDFEDEGEDSLTIALSRSAEMKSGENPGITLEELMAGVQAGRVKNEASAAYSHAA